MTRIIAVLCMCKVLYSHVCKERTTEVVVGGGGGGGVERKSGSFVARGVKVGHLGHS